MKTTQNMLRTCIALQVALLEYEDDSIPKDKVIKAMDEILISLENDFRKLRKSENNKIVNRT